jgi:hypothetical protein
VEVCEARSTTGRCRYSIKFYLQLELITIAKDRPDGAQRSNNKVWKDP